MSDEPKRCHICGETDPWPKWICVVKMDGSATRAVKAKGKCPYSLEADERLKAQFFATERAHD